MAAFRQTKLSTLPGWENLSELVESGRLTVTRLDWIESLSRHPSYWLVALRDAGAPYAWAVVSDEGWLLSATRSPLDRATLDVNRGREVAADLGYSNATVRQVYIYGDLTAKSGSSAYRPVLEVRAADRAPVYLTQTGAVFRADPSGDLTSYERGGERRFTRIR